jgi:hypothetical protein
MSFSEWINIIASVGTFLSALIAAYTIIEVRKQRRSSYKPELFLDSFCYFASNNPLLYHELVMYRVSPFNEIFEGKNENPKRISVNYKLENLGFGIAKSVECQWEFDYKKAIEIIEDQLPDGYYLNRVLDDYISLEHVSKSIYISFYLKDLEKQAFDFVRPASVGENKKHLAIPNIIIDCYLIVLILKYQLLENTCKNYRYEEFEDFPKVTLNLKYKDLQNKVYKKKLSLNISSASNQVEDSISFIKDHEYAIFYVKVNLN